MFRAAVKDKVIGSDPTDGVRLPRGRRADAAMSIPTPEEIEQLMAVADDRFRPYIALCAFAGSWSAPAVPCRRSLLRTRSYAGRMLDLVGIEVEEIATALADQTDYEHRWLIDPRTGQVAFWTSDTGIDGENPVEIDELNLIPIDPLPSRVWFQDMADFAEGVSDSAASRRLTQCLQGRGAFRRFKNELYQHHPDLISAWHALRDVRAQRRAVVWLLDQGLVDDTAAHQFATDHPDPDLP
ncbi:MAG: UPF0158 family protein [Nocardioidaceae bacterium]